MELTEPNNQPIRRRSISNQSFQSCYNCPKEKKYLGCHDTCVDYLTEKEQHNIIKKRIEKAKEKYSYFSPYKKRK